MKKNRILNSKILSIRKCGDISIIISKIAQISIRNPMTFKKLNDGINPMSFEELI